MVATQVRWLPLPPLTPRLGWSLSVQVGYLWTIRITPSCLHIHSWAFMRWDASDVSFVCITLRFYWSMLLSTDTYSEGTDLFSGLRVASNREPVRYCYEERVVSREGKFRRGEGSGVRREQILQKFPKLSPRRLGFVK